jgi:hypothetical protein
MRCAVLVLLVACGGSVPAAEVDRAGAVEARGRAPALGMNDVSILLPLPRAGGAPVLAGLDEGLIDRRWYDALVGARGDIGPRSGEAIAFEDFQVVAVRFDLCDRTAIGVCPRDAVGRLRLVLQPLYVRHGATFAHDVALHAFYPIPADEVGRVVEALRQLARRGHAAPGAPLAVSPAAAAGDAAYLSGLRGLVGRHARAAELVRLTVIGQVADAAAFAWIFRGLDREGDGFVAMMIPGVAAAQQTVQLAGGDTVYRSEPIADVPAGFALATNGPRFAAAPPGERAAAVAALAALQNPTLHDTVDTQCIGCHLATFLTARRAATSGIDPAALPGWFATRAAAVPTIARQDARVVRAFGWAGDAPAISQRVVNDTAEVLSEIAARFGP